MPLPHPYPLPARSGPHRTCVHCTIPLSERFLLASMAPQHGAFEPILATLLKNLIDDVRKLNPTGELVLDGTRILEILCERRPLTADQLFELTATTSVAYRVRELGGHAPSQPPGGQDEPAPRPGDSAPLRPGATEPPDEPSSDESSTDQGGHSPRRKKKSNPKRRQPSKGGTGE